MLLPGLFALGFAQTGVVAPTGDFASDATLRVPIDPADPLLAFAWDGASESPSLFGTGEALLDPGFPAPHTDDVLRFSCDEGRGDVLHDSVVASRLLSAARTQWTRGRFGWAAQLAAPVRVEFADGSIDAEWTAGFFIRPERRSPPTMILEGEGSFSIAVDADGFIAARITRMNGHAIELRSQLPLPLARWTHVALAFDDRTFHHVRLIVGDAFVWAPLGAAVVRSPRALRIAGEGIALDEVRVAKRALTTAALLERSRTAIAAGEHVWTLRFRSGLRERRIWAGVLRSATANGEQLASHADLRRVVAKADGLRWVPGQWTRSTANDEPLPRTAHPVVYVGDHRALIFGGEIRDTHTPPMINRDETWLYDLEQKKWTRAGVAPAPPPRCHMPAAYAADQHLLLLVGGWFNGGPEKKLFSDTWTFDTRATRWQQRTPKGVKMPALSDAGLVYHPVLKRFLLFTNAGNFAYDPAQDRWEQRPKPTVVDREGRPAERTFRISPMMGFDPGSEQILSFGGARQQDGKRVYLGDTSLYDAARNQWTVLEPKVAPSPRVRSGFAYDNRRARFVLFGGVRDQFSTRDRDLWSFDARTRIWTPLEAANTPSARGGFYGMAYDPERDEFALLAGRHAVDRFLAEAWHLSLDPTAPGRAAWAFDRDAAAGADRVWVEFSGDGEPSLDVSTSPDTNVWSPRTTRSDARFVRLTIGFLPVVENTAAPLRVRALGLAVGRAPCAGRAGCVERALPPYSAPPPASSSTTSPSASDS
jgi:hypothetical protein